MQAPKTFIVYDRRTDALICIGTSRECAAFLGCRRQMINESKSRQAAGKTTKYEIFDLDELAGDVP